MSAKKKLRKPVVISIGNHKGGVGKTAIAIHLATYFLDYVDRTLIIDMDSQANASQWLLKAHLDDVQYKVEDLLRYALRNPLVESEDHKQEYITMANEAAVTFSDRANKSYSIICSSLDLGYVRQEYSSRHDDGNFLLRDALRIASTGYDVTLIDTPPGIDLPALGSVSASDLLLIPVTPDPLAIHGGMDTLKYVYPKAKRYYNYDVNILGFAINMANPTTTSREGVTAVRTTFADFHVFNTEIKRSVKIAELPGKQKTLQQASPRSESAELFSKLAKEVFEQILTLQEEERKNG